MRLATFNILHGRSPNDGVVDPGRLAGAVAALDPDVLGLQEVDRNQPRSGRADLTAVAGRAMGARAHLFVPALLGTPGRMWVPALTDQPDAASFGIALLSRYPVTRWEIHRLPWIGAGFPLPLPGRRDGIMIREEPRLAVAAHLDTPSGERVVVNTHLTYLPGWSRRQLRKLRDILAVIDKPVALMGDFNMVGSQPGAITGYRSLAAVRTFPGGSPRVQLDHILIRGAWGEVVRSRAVHLPVSDHRALVVDLADAAQPPPGRE
jgi:endonuclease/exonuclease/phosphatase family metal-dependent hydrolase